MACVYTAYHRSDLSDHHLCRTADDGKRLFHGDDITGWRHDIIVFPYKYEEDTYYIKRIIGMPGETVQIRDGYVYIDGKRLTSDIYGKEKIKDPQTAAEPVTLGDDEYFVMGDNRNHSMDSRDPGVGVLTRKDLIGRAWVRIYPFDNIGVIRHE